MMDELIRLLAAIDSPTTIAIGVRLLALCNERGGVGCETYDYPTIS